MVFRNTNSEKGRHLAVTPRNSTMRHLSYGRIILDAAQSSVSFNNGDQETGLICLAGNAMVKTAAQQIEIGNSTPSIFHEIHRLSFQQAVP